jgi:hypothetical protein
VKILPNEACFACFANGFTEEKDFIQEAVSMMTW